MFLNTALYSILICITRHNRHFNANIASVYSLCINFPLHS